MKKLFVIIICLLSLTGCSFVKYAFNTPIESYPTHENYKQYKYHYNEYYPYCRHYYYIAYKPYNKLTPYKNKK
jgi:uncharacterized protein YceK